MKKIKHFLHLSDYSGEELWEILHLSKKVKAKFIKKEDYTPFKNRSLAMIFAKPSARTRVSFETGFGWMGGNALFLGPNDIGIGKREAIKDISRVFSRYNDIIMARLFDHQHIVELAKHSSIPVVNGLTDYNHPCQIMADIFTIWEHLENIENIKVTYLGDGNNIVHSWLRLAMILPLHFVCCCPEGYEPNAKTVKEARDAGVSKIEILKQPNESSLALIYSKDFGLEYNLAFMNYCLSQQLSNEKNFFILNSSKWLSNCDIFIKYHNRNKCF